MRWRGVPQLAMCLLLQPACRRAAATHAPGAPPTSALDLRALADRANHCQRDDECTSVGSICGIGCYVLAHRDAARGLSEAAARNPVQCDFSCVAPGAIACEAGRCVMRAAAAR